MAKAIKAKYPILPEQISALCKQIDDETGGWYQGRPMALEASRAIEYSLHNL